MAPPTASTVGMRISIASLVHMAVSRSRMRWSTPARSDAWVRKRFDVDPRRSPAVVSTARWVSWRIPRVPKTSMAASSSRVC